MPEIVAEAFKSSQSRVKRQTIVQTNPLKHTQ